MEKDTKYRKYLEALKKATKKESFLERRMKLAGPKINKDTLHKTLMSGKNPYSDLVNTTNKDFVKRRMELAGKDALSYATKAAKASKYGKIAGAVAAAGIAGSAFLRSKMKDIKEKQQAEGKMGGGIMYKKKHGGMHKKKKGGMPKYDMGGGVQKAKEHKEKIKDVAGSVFGYIGEMSKGLEKLNPLVAGTGYAKDYIQKKIKKSKEEKALRELPENLKRRPRSNETPSVQDRIKGFNPRNKNPGYYPRESGRRPVLLSTGGMKKYNSGSMVHVKTKLGKSKPTKIC